MALAQLREYLVASNARCQQFESSHSNCYFVKKIGKIPGSFFFIFVFQYRFNAADTK